MITILIGFAVATVLCWAVLTDPDFVAWWRSRQIRRAERSFVCDPCTYRKVTTRPDTNGRTCPRCGNAMRQEWPRR